MSVIVTNIGFRPKLARWLILLSISINIGVLLTFLATQPSFTTPDGILLWKRGFPYPWTTTVGVSCGSPLTSYATINLPFGGCLKSFTTFNDWEAFQIDLAFYVLITFVLVLLSSKFYSRIKRRISMPQP